MSSKRQMGDPSPDDIPWGLLVTRSTMDVLSEVMAEVGEHTVWTFLPPIPDEKRGAYIAEMASLLATVASSDARKKVRELLEKRKECKP